MPDITGELPSPQWQTSPPSPPEHRFGRDQYWQMVEAGVLRPDDKVELLDGKVVDMSPQGLAHIWALQRLYELVVLACSRDARVFVQMPLPLGAASVPEPDLYVISRDVQVRTYPDQVLLVVEVADTSLATDRDIKGPIYAAAGVPEYWIVDLTHQVFEVYRDPRNGRYASLVTLSPGEVAHAIAVEGLSVDIAAVLA